MKKKSLGIVIFVFAILSLYIIYILSELYSESELDPVEPKITDAIKFKTEYENLNNKENNNSIAYRTLNIDEDNMIIYSTPSEIIEKINNKETFIVYFGYAECTWCRNVIETAIKSAKEKNVKKIYYVDISNIRDKYELDDNNNLFKSVEGTDEYYTLLELMDNILDNYEPITYKTSKGKTKTVQINEKRIYGPEFILVKNGTVSHKESGISSLLKEENQELNDGILCDIKSKFDCFFDYYEEENLSCSIDIKC